MNIIRFINLLTFFDSARRSIVIEIQLRRTNCAIEKYFLGDSITFDSIQLTLTVEEIYDCYE